jgi:hypothetical protein
VVQRHLLYLQADELADAVGLDFPDGDSLDGGAGLEPDLEAPVEDRRDGVGGGPRRSRLVAAHLRLHQLPSKLMCHENGVLESGSGPGPLGCRSGS